jgi:hypothetical protein
MSLVPCEPTGVRCFTPDSGCNSISLYPSLYRSPFSGEGAGIIRSYVCYHAATGTAQTSATHHDDDFSESPVFCWVRSCWVGSVLGWSELLISGPSLRPLHGPPYFFNDLNRQCLRCANFVLNTAQKTKTDRTDSTRSKSRYALSIKGKAGNQSQNREFKNTP